MKHHFFGNDFETNTNGFPPGRKLVITDELLNEWLASQWTNFSLNNVPLNKPPKMDASLHRRFLNQFQQNKEKARKQRIESEKFRLLCEGKEASAVDEDGIPSDDPKPKDQHAQPASSARPKSGTQPSSVTELPNFPTKNK